MIKYVGLIVVALGTMAVSAGERLADLYSGVSNFGHVPMKHSLVADGCHLKIVARAMQPDLFRQSVTLYYLPDWFSYDSEPPWDYTSSWPLRLTKELDWPNDEYPKALYHLQIEAVQQLREEEPEFIERFGNHPERDMILQSEISRRSKSIALSIGFHPAMGRNYKEVWGKSETGLELYSWDPISDFSIVMDISMNQPFRELLWEHYRTACRQ